MLTDPGSRHRHRDDAPESDREADAVLVTVAAPTKPNRRPARRHRRWRHTRSVVVTLDGA